MENGEEIIIYDPFDDAQDKFMIFTTQKIATAFGLAMTFVSSFFCA